LKSADLEESPNRVHLHPMLIGFLDTAKRAFVVNDSTGRERPNAALVV
jgi:hypothetical protein